MRSKLEDGRDRRPVLINDHGDRRDAPRVARRQGRAHGERNNRRIFRPIGYIERKEAVTVLEWAALEDVHHKPGPWIVGGGLGGKRGPAGDGPERDRHNGRHAQYPNVRPRHCGSSRAPAIPSRTLPPVSMTATASSPTMKPTFPIAPAFARVISA